MLMQAHSPLAGPSGKATPAVPPHPQPFDPPPCAIASEPGTAGGLCMSRDSEPWDRRHHVPADANAYGLRRVDEAAAHDTRHDPVPEEGALATGLPPL